MGKGKVCYVKHVQCGDRVVITNAKGVKVTGRKADTKTYAHYTGYPGGYEELPFKEVLSKHPERIIEEAVKRMLPKNRLRAKLLKRLHIYAGAEHEQAAHKPVVLN